MALNKDKDLKKYFSISEVATQFGVAESVLRFGRRSSQTSSHSRLSAT